jgi:endonuclease YncB( thermonuclease family)
VFSLDCSAVETQPPLNLASTSISKLGAAEVFRLYLKTTCTFSNNPFDQSHMRFLCVEVCVALVWFALSAPVAQAATGLDRVIGVSDGDTITVLTASKTQLKIRLAGIDAPESGQAFGNRSKQTLSDCAFGKQASIEGDKVDRYGRTVAKIVVAGVDCNLRQVELGMAWHYKKYAFEQPPADRAAYAAAETAARSAKRGLWADTKAEAPWEWRASHAERAATSENAGGCDCAAGNQCTGKRGAAYCVTDSGRKKYLN